MEDTFQTKYHPSIANCHYFKSVIYKRQQLYERSIGEIKECIEIRKEAIGKDSLPLAHAYEHYAKVLFKTQNKSKVLLYINMALSIWRGKVTNPNHEDLLRVSMLAILYSKEINKENDEIQEKINKDKIMKKDDIYEDSFISPLNLSRLISTKYKADKEVNEDIKYEDKHNLSHSGSNHSASRVISDQRNTSQLVRDGFDHLTDLLKTEDKGTSNSYIVTFILSLTDRQLEFLNQNMNSILPGPQVTMQSIDLDFKNMLKPFQYELFKKSKIWTVPKDNYLILEHTNPGIGPDLKRRLLLNSEIKASNLLILEKSPFYDQELLAKEQEEDEKFLDMMRQKSGSDILKFLLPEQLRIFENIIHNQYPLKYFTNTIKESQVDAFKQEVSQSYHSIQEYSGEGEYLQEEEGHSYYQEEDNLDFQDYADAIIQGINSIPSVHVFTILDFGIEFPQDYFLERDLDELKEDFISFVNKLTASQLRKIYKSNPILTSESMMNSVVNKHSFTNELSQDSKNEIFFDNQLPKAEGQDNLHLEDKFKYFDGANISSNMINIQDREEPVENIHPLVSANPKTISSIGKFTNTDGDDQEGLFEDLNRELNPNENPGTPSKKLYIPMNMS